MGPIPPVVSHGKPALSEEPFATEVRRKSRRLRKFARRMAINALGLRRPETRVVFIMGAQRSGTRVPLVALESAPDIVTYREGARPYFQEGRLAEEDTLNRLFDSCRFPVLVLKPLCESHRARQLVSQFRGSRVLWIFRSFPATVRSASLKWSSGVEAVEQIVHDRLRPNDWRRGGLTPELLEIARRLYRPGLSLDHANAILWYLRSRILIDLDLFSCRDAMVIKYEDLTSDPKQHFRRVFDFVGHPLQSAYLSDVRQNPSRNAVLADVPTDVIHACEELYADIDRRYHQSLQR